MKLETFDFRKKKIKFFQLKWSYDYKLYSVSQITWLNNWNKNFKKYQLKLLKMINIQTNF